MNVASAVSFVWDTKPDFPSYEPIMEAVRSNPCISLPLDVLNKGF